MTIFQNKMRYWPAYPTNFPISVCACQLGALHLTFSKATGIWTAKETGVFIGENMGLQGKQRAAVWVRFLHQEERLSRYVAGMYHECMNVLLHLLPPPPPLDSQPLKGSPILPLSRVLSVKRESLLASCLGGGQALGFCVLSAIGCFLL